MKTANLKKQTAKTYTQMEIPFPNQDATQLELQFPKAKQVDIELGKQEKKKVA